MSVRIKLIVLVMISFILGTSIIGIYSIWQIQTNTIKSAHEKLSTDLTLGMALIDERIPGEWSIKDNLLYKGDTIINDHFEIVDAIGQLTGDTVTIFQGRTRISTNVKDSDGNRVVGTNIANNVAEQVLNKGEVFIGEAEVAGEINQTAYEPIKNSSGDIIGIWYVGVPNSPYEKLAMKVTLGIISIIVIQLVIAIFLFYRIITKSIQPLLNIKEVAHKVSKGDLAVNEIKIKSKDEIGLLGSATNHMINNLRNMIIEVSKTVHTLSNAANEMAQSANQTSITTEQVTLAMNDVAEGSKNQLQGTVETLKATENNTKGIMRISDSTSMVLNESAQTLSLAEEGNNYIKSAIQQMENVDCSVKDSISKIHDLVHYSNEISEILSIIMNIAQQTNLLSLNAAIEAARAGENGKGFAVVADEVRKLAEQTSESTNQVTKIIEKIQLHSKISIEAMNKVNNEAEVGIDIVEKTGTLFLDILAATKNVHVKIEDISYTSDQMSASSQEITASIAQIAEIAKNTSTVLTGVAATSEEQLATMEEMNALSDNLLEVSDNLDQLVSVFKL